ncbi:DUF6415 family natural product biosynthesis protein [Streptomyces sp. NPDC005236]|uniref:DUF6415 family natural product biosynthesis protein n=1 Tax=Streptomyces sp. NPDC005236 TaxID=3157028 RepID=UPI0033A7EED4
MRDPIDADTIREAIAVGLDVWGTCPRGGEALDLLIQRLEGHARLLLFEVEELSARMSGRTHSTAVHVLSRTRQTLAQPEPGSYVEDLAVAVRALLELAETPGRIPVGA